MSALITNAVVVRYIQNQAHFLRKFFKVFNSYLIFHKSCKEIYANGEGKSVFTFEFVGEGVGGVGVES